MSPFDVLTMGRVGVDLYPEQSGISLAEVSSFAKSLGGTATNVAVGAARYGYRAAVITKVGADGFGDYVRRALRGFGVDDRFVGTHPTLRTPVVFCELFPPDNFPLLFYREPTAPDMTITSEEIDLDEVRASRVFWTTGTGLSAQPSRDATLAALQARGRNPLTIHDLDYRPMFWSEPEEAGRWQREALGHATVSVGNLEECAVAVGDGGPDELADRLLDLGLDLAVVKLGPDGVLVAWEGGRSRVDPVEVTVVNGLGAGDAFGAALCHGLLQGWDATKTVRFANAAGAYVAARLACADAMPNEDEVMELLDRA
ncbi:MAG TPA: 5-dehydro-2-deoxygluconokinase [Acidimicrobiia bacterium]|jgi:5-dehydro-2-deoxygluconokinase|nr:5-dehydro-2-deoxygluconokinase [Acidimicrobiia bacterium]